MNRAEQEPKKRNNAEISAIVDASKEFARMQELSKLEKAVYPLVIAAGITSTSILLYLAVNEYVSHNVRVAMWFGIASAGAILFDGMVAKMTLERFRTAKSAKEGDKTIVASLVENGMVAKNRLNPPSINRTE